MAKKKVEYVTIPDELYLVLYSMRYENNNCQSVRLSPKDSKGKGEFNALQYDTGLQYLVVFPKSSTPPSDWY